MKHVGILVIIETKLDDTFPTSEFLVDGFSESLIPDRNTNGNSIMIFVLADISSKLLQNMISLLIMKIHIVSMKKKIYLMILILEFQRFV